MPPRRTRASSGQRMQTRAAQLTSASQELKCSFCGTPRGVGAFGELLTVSDLQGLQAHYFCLLFSRCNRRGPVNAPLRGFDPSHAVVVLHVGDRWACKFCQKMGATIRCCLVDCLDRFHGPCGIANGCLFQYFGEYRAYCPNHRPQQHIVPLDAPGDTCATCLEPMARPPSLSVLVTPCCRRLMHRDCIQQQANSAGHRCFRCAYCNNQEQFLMEMADHGIFIPQQDASWEREPHAFEELLFRYRHCDAPCCRCPMGRDYSGGGISVWKVIVCNGCGARGVHAACGHLDASSESWVCSACSQVIGQGSAGSGVQTSRPPPSEAVVIVIDDDDDEFGARQPHGTLESASAVRGEPRTDTMHESASGERQEPDTATNTNTRLFLVCETISGNTITFTAVPESVRTFNGNTRIARQLESSAGRQTEERDVLRLQNFVREVAPRARQQPGAPRRGRSAAEHRPCTAVACSICRPGGAQATSADLDGSSQSDPNECPVGNMQAPPPEDDVVVIEDADGDGGEPDAARALVIIGDAGDVEPRNDAAHESTTHGHGGAQGLYYMGTEYLGQQHFQFVPANDATLATSSGVVFGVRADRA